jgi:hypothetical protein
VVLRRGCLVGSFGGATRRAHTHTHTHTHTRLEDAALDLLAPLERVLAEAPHGRVRVEELQDPVLAHVLQLLQRLLPAQRAADLRSQGGGGEGD